MHLHQSSDLSSSLLVSSSLWAFAATAASVQEARHEIDLTIVHAELAASAAPALELSHVGSLDALLALEGEAVRDSLVIKYEGSSPLAVVDSCHFINSVWHFGKLTPVGYGLEVVPQDVGTLPNGRDVLQLLHRGRASITVAEYILVGLWGCWISLIWILWRDLEILIDENPTFLIFTVVKMSVHEWGVVVQPNALQRVVVLLCKLPLRLIFRVQVSRMSCQNLPLCMFSAIKVIIHISGQIFWKACQKFILTVDEAVLFLVSILVDDLSKSLDTCDSTSDHK